MLTKEGRSKDLRSCKRPLANHWLCQFSDVAEVKMQNSYFLLCSSSQWMFIDSIDMVLVCSSSDLD